MSVRAESSGSNSKRPVHQEYMSIGYSFSFALAVASIPFSILAGAVAWIWAGQDTAIPVMTVSLFFCTAIIALALIFSYSGAHWILTEQVSADLWDREAQREMLKSAGIVQQNINTGSGTIKPKIQAPRIKVMGRDISWGQVNQISQSSPEPRRIEIPREDVLWMLEQFVNVKHSKRPFLGEELPNSRLPAYPDLYNEIIRILVDGRAIIGRDNRVAGHLVIKDVSALTQLVDRAHPGGVVLELPAST